MGEKAVKDRLRLDLRVLFHWNEREPKFFQELYKEPFDIGIPKKNGSYYTLEIKTTKEYGNHKNVIIPESNWKKSDFAIGVKILKFDLGRKKTACGFIAGYLKKDEIMNIKPEYGEGTRCPLFPGRCKGLMELNPISVLWEKLQNKCIRWESA